MKIIVETERLFLRDNTCIGNISEDLIMNEYNACLMGLLHGKQIQSVNLDRDSIQSLILYLRLFRKDIS